MDKKIDQELLSVLRCSFGADFCKLHVLFNVVGHGGHEHSFVSIAGPRTRYRKIIKFHHSLRLIFFLLNTPSLEIGFRKNLQFLEVFA
ncbi:MAG TPA: hypothetical protein DDX92_07800 [Flavobacteriales bacterium]|jgi:hypothetical protein|nr:hypothetical protein [Flavobacteriales bacterium]